MWFNEDTLDVLNTLSQCGYSNKMEEVFGLLKANLDQGNDREGMREKEVIVYVCVCACVG